MVSRIKDHMNTQTPRQLLNDLQKALEERSRFGNKKAKVNYEYIAGFTLSMLQTLASVSDKAHQEIANHIEYLKTA